MAERGGLAQFSLHHPVRTIIFVQSLLRNRLGANIFIQQVMLLVHLSPIILVLVVIALGRRPPVQAAMAGALLALVLWLQGLAVPYSHVVAGYVLQDAEVLFASVASVMAPGLLLVVLMAQTDANCALCDWVQDLGLHAQGQLVFILLGLGPMLESLTGFGVSWIAVVPLLLALFPRKQAVRMALASMLIMPWGTLGLATITGAALLNTPADVLARYTALTSAPVFVGLMGVAVWLAGYRHWQALLAGLSQLDKAEEQSLNRFALGVVALNMLLVAAGGRRHGMAGIFVSLGYGRCRYNGQAVHDLAELWLGITAVSHCCMVCVMREQAR